MQGILCELLDVTDLRKLFQLKETLLERLHFQVRNNLESVLVAATLLRDPKVPEAKRARVLDILKAKINESVDVLAEMRQFLQTELGMDMIERYPVDALAPAREAAGELAEEARKRSVSFRLELADLVSLVFASPQELRETIRDLLALLVQDAVEESEVLVRVEEREGWILYHLENKGFGLPGDRFQSYLFGSGAVTSAEFKKARAALQRIRRWGGELEASSAVGEGIRFSVRLKGFI